MAKEGAIKSPQPCQKSRYLLNNSYPRKVRLEA